MFLNNKQNNDHLVCNTYDIFRVSEFKLIIIHQYQTL